MKRMIWVMGILLCSSLSYAAVFLDEDRSILFTMRTYTLARILTQEPELFRREFYNVGAWSLLQHRTYLEPQLMQDLSTRTDVTPVLKWFKDRLKIDRMKYFIGMRIEYDGVYDYGPDFYRKRLPDEITDDLKLRTRLFEVYGDFRFLERLYFRIGKQNISWGETDVFRLLDQINPLDQTFGGFLTSLDERRVPSFMIKGIFDIGSLWKFYSLSLEGFIEPEPTLTKGPTLPAGAPWAIITGPPSPFEMRMPEKEAWKDSRFGGRLMGTIGDYTFSLAHYWTYIDNPTPYLRFDKTIFDPVIKNIPEAEEPIKEKFPSGVPYLELGYPRIMLSGASLSGPLPFSPYSIIRLEFAYIYNYPLFIPEKNIPILRPVLELPDEKLDDYPSQLNALLEQKAILAEGVEGEIEKRGMVRWAIGMDRNQWIRFLNPRQTFFLSAQFFGEHIRELPDGVSYSIQNRVEKRVVTLPDGSSVTLSKPYFVKISPNSYKATFLIRTGYPVLRGYLGPEFSMIMEFGNFDMFACVIQPSLNYYRDPFRVRVEYNYLGGDYSGVGFLKDRDNLMLKIEYLL